MHCAAVDGPCSGLSMMFAQGSTDGCSLICAWAVWDGLRVVRSCPTPGNSAVRVHFGYNTEGKASTRWAWAWVGGLLPPPPPPPYRCGGSEAPQHEGGL